MKLNKIKLPPDTLLWDSRFSALHFSVLTVADELNLFSFLKKTPLTLKNLANNLNVDVRSIEALTGVLVALGFLKKADDKIKITSEAKAYLIPDSPFYWGALLMAFRNRDEHQRIKTAMQSTTGIFNYNNKSLSDMWEKGTLSADAALDFTRKMHAMNFSCAASAANSGVFKGTKKLLDMGGGSGCFSIAFVNQYPKHLATVFELPEVGKITQDYINQFEMTKKIDIHSGNFFNDPWPRGYDGILFSQIFHDWPKEYCKILARKAYEALEPGGQIFVHEMLLNESKTGPLAAVSFDLLMLINHRSQQFTKKELFDLLLDAGFKKPKQTKTSGYYSVISATKD